MEDTDIRKPANRIDIIAGELRKLQIAKDQISDAANEIAEQTAAMLSDEDPHIKEGAEELTYYPNDLSDLASQLDTMNKVIDKVVNRWKELGFNIIEVPQEWKELRDLPEAEKEKWKGVSSFFDDLAVRSKYNKSGFNCKKV